MPNPINIITTSLPEYVDQNRTPLLKEVVLDGAVLDHLTLQTGIKTKAAINYLGVNTIFQDGRTCGNSKAGSVELTQRTIEVAEIKIFDEICPKTLLGKWAEYQVRTSALDEADRMPFEEFVVNLIVNDIRYKRDLAIWQGDTDIVIDESSTPEDYAKCRFDGFLKKAGEEAGTVDVNIAAGSTAFAAIRKVVAAIPRGFINKTKVFVSPEFFLTFVMEMVDRNMFHYAGPEGEYPKELTFPGTGIKVVSQDGLTGVNFIYASQSENMFYGTDMLDDAEEIKIWFSDDDDVWKYKVQFCAGVEVAFPDRVVLGALAETPTADDVVTAGDSLKAIAVAAAAIAENTGDDGTLDTALGTIATNTGAIAENTGEDGALDTGLQGISDAISGDENTPDPQPGQ